MHFRGEHAKAWAEAVQDGTEIFYEREPDNQFDPSAIKVMYNMQHVGYVERMQAAFISVQLDRGIEYKCVVTGKVFERNNTYPLTLWTPVIETETETEAYEEA
jgi:hypothetical protein